MMEIQAVELENQQLRLEVATLQRRLENSLRAQKECLSELEVETDMLTAKEKFRRMVSDLMSTDGSEGMVLSNIGMGICGEAGEVVDILKKVAHHDHPLDDKLKTKLCLEVGDTLFYIEALMQYLYIRESECYELVETKLRSRYPRGRFNSEDSINRKV